jgi:hypothetical protein
MIGFTVQRLMELGVEDADQSHALAALTSTICFTATAANRTRSNAHSEAAQGTYFPGFLERPAHS